MPNTTSASPKVATTSPSHSRCRSAPGSRASTARSPNIRLATHRPDDAPRDLRDDVHARVARADPAEDAVDEPVMTGLRWAPDTDPSARMIATSAAPVATAFSKSSRPTSSGLSFAAAIPEPITAITRTRCR